MSSFVVKLNVIVVCGSLIYKRDTASLYSNNAVLTKTKADMMFTGSYLMYQVKSIFKLDQNE